MYYVDWFLFINVRSHPYNRHYKMALISGVLTGKQVVCACAGVFFRSLCPACPVASSGLMVSNQSGWNTSPIALRGLFKDWVSCVLGLLPRSWSTFSWDALKLCCRRIWVCPVCVLAGETPHHNRHIWCWDPGNATTSLALRRSLRNGSDPELHWKVSSESHS